MVRAFRRLGHDAHPWAKTYQRDEWLLPPWGPDAADLLLYMECNDSEPQYETASCGRKRAYWEFDTAARCTDIDDWRQRQGFDAVFMANRRRLANGARYLPYAADPELLKPSGMARGGAAIVGSAFPPRKRFADALDIPLRTGLFGDDYARAIGELLVHVHHHDSGGEGLIVMRPWETMALGTCLLTQRTPEMEELFQDGVHCVYYDNETDAREKLRLLFIDRQRTEAIGERGRAEVLAKHTYLHRAKTILEALAC